MSDSLADLLGRAAAGDGCAWRSIVDRFQPRLWRIARLHRLGEADAADVVAFCWLTLADNLRQLREPEALPAWLSTVARRESLRIATARARESVRGEWDAEAAALPGPDRQVLLGERDASLWAAVARLPERCRALVTLLAVAPELTYPQLAGALGIPPGSVGPNRGRCLARLRRNLARTGFFEEAG